MVEEDHRVNTPAARPIPSTSPPNRTPPRSRTRIPPWQMAWKQPQWHTFSAAAVSPSSSSSELPPVRQQPNQTNTTNSTTTTNTTNSTTSEKETEAVDDDTIVVVELSTAQLAPHEVTQLLPPDTSDKVAGEIMIDEDDERRSSSSKGKGQAAEVDNVGAGEEAEETGATRAGGASHKRYILSISLLGLAPALSAATRTQRQQQNAAATGPQAHQHAQQQQHQPRVASEVLLEVVEIVAVTTGGAAAAAGTTTTTEVVPPPPDGAAPEEAMRVVRAKRLRWPESIQNPLLRPRSSSRSKSRNSHHPTQPPPPQTKPQQKQKKQKKPNINLFTSMFGPLLGIEEAEGCAVGVGDDASIRRTKPPAPRHPQQQPAAEDDEAVGISERPVVATNPPPQQQKPGVGIVSATLCRRPRGGVTTMDGTTAHHPANTLDIVELMSFDDGGSRPRGGGGGGGVVAGPPGHHPPAASSAAAAAAVATTPPPDVDDQTDDVAAATATGRNREPHAAEATREGATTSQPPPTTPDPTRRTTTKESVKELCFVCVATTGDVYVYDPIQLLLGSENSTTFTENATTTTSTIVESDSQLQLEQMSSFFFGPELFQNLQETWKPLAEPTARIHLSIFQYDEHHHRIVQDDDTKVLKSNTELGHWAKSVLSSSSADPTPQTQQTTTTKNKGRKTKQSRANTKDDASDMSGTSSRNSRWSRTSSGSTVLSGVAELAHDLQTTVEDTVSMLPYLLNPLLEPSTLHDRTIQNTPLEITVAGDAYVVVTGSGYKRTHSNQSGGIVASSLNTTAHTTATGTASNRNNNKQKKQDDTTSDKGESRKKAVRFSVTIKANHDDSDEFTKESSQSTRDISSSNDGSAGRTDARNDTHDNPFDDEHDEVTNIPPFLTLLPDTTKSPINEETEGTQNPFDNNADNANVDDDSPPVSTIPGIPDTPATAATTVTAMNPFEDEVDNDRSASSVILELIESASDNNNPFDDDDDKEGYDVNDKEPIVSEESVVVVEKEDTELSRWDNTNDNKQDDNQPNDDAHNDSNEVSGAEDKRSDEESNSHDNNDSSSARNKESSPKKADSTAPSLGDSGSNDDIFDDNNLTGTDGLASQPLTDTDRVFESSHKKEDEEITPSNDDTKDCNNDDEDINYSSQRHYFDDYSNTVQEDEDDECGRGGFVTFLSTTQWSETRTLFIPFVPMKVSHVAEWKGMELLWIIGEYKTLLIRMDTNSGPVAVPIGFGTPLSNITNNNKSPPTFLVKKFQILPIELGVTGSIQPILLCASGSGIDPPSLLELYTDSVDEELSLNNQTNYNDTRSSMVNDQQPWQKSYLRHDKHALVLLKTLDYCTSYGTVILHHARSHVAKITIDEEQRHAGTLAHRTFTKSEQVEPTNELLSVWAYHGQGYSLFGCNHNTYFLCWEGSTLLQGAYVEKLNRSLFQKSKGHSSFPCCPAKVLPLSLNYTKTARMVNSIEFDIIQEGSRVHPHLFSCDADPHNSFSTVFQYPVAQKIQEPSLLININEKKKLKDCLSDDADEEQSNTDFLKESRSSGTFSNETLLSTGSVRQRKTERLLQQCTSWTQLQDSVNDRVVLERQHPILFFRNGAVQSSLSILSLRQIVVDNGVASPFQQVLAWLAKRKNFFAATGIALALLQDSETLFYLWKHAEMINEENEETKLIGLLDGINSVRILDNDTTKINTTASLSCDRSVTVVHLSEMTIGCFIKGGCTMAKSLSRFLAKNKFYDPYRVSLMLAFAVINGIEDFDHNDHSEYRCKSFENNQDVPYDEYLWPVKSLLAVGTSRHYLLEVLQLLNKIIPNELRNRSHHYENKEVETRKIANEPAPSMILTKTLVQLIIESDPSTIDILMSFADDQCKVFYWQSLDHGTRSIISLMKIDSYFPFLRHPEVRTWVREQLILCFQHVRNQSMVFSTSWLQELCVACLHNGDCDLQNLGINIDDNEKIDTISFSLAATLSDTSDATFVTSLNKFEQSIHSDNMYNDDDGVLQLKNENKKIRNALIPSRHIMFCLDYDLLIPILLLLQRRNADWFPSSMSASITLDCVSTQSLLDAACFHAGRISTTVSVSDNIGGQKRHRVKRNRTSILTSQTMRDQSNEESLLFATFDSKSAMRQCFQANNMLAGANLIGGTKGFILIISHILIESLGIPASDAECFLVNDVLDLQAVQECKMEISLFEFTTRHRLLLLLLEEHVLSIKTFGDFDSVHSRGQVDPVFASRSILRAWLSLSYGDTTVINDSTNWLSDWLASRLEIRRLSSSQTQPGTMTVFPTKDDNDYVNNEDTNISNKYPLACAALVRSLLWANSNATPTSSNDVYDDGKGEVDTFQYIPLAIEMNFEKNLLIELCQSCLGLVESVPTSLLKELSFQ